MKRTGNSLYLQSHTVQGKGGEGANKSSASHGQYGRLAIGSWGDLGGQIIQKYSATMGNKGQVCSQNHPALDTQISIYMKLFSKEYSKNVVILKISEA